jgi:RHS repeat-associated protein
MITQYVRFGDGQVRQIKRGVTSPVAQDYATHTLTANGLVATVADARGNLTTYEYDGHDRLAKTRFPSPTTPGVSSTTDFESHAYDANGNRTQTRTRAGQLIDYAYDALDRLIERDDSMAALGRAEFGYDLLGREVSARYAGGVTPTVTMSYDKASRLLGQALADGAGPSAAIAYQYDAGGNRTRITWPEGDFHVTYAYDGLGRVTSIKELGTTDLATYAWDDLSRLTTLNLGNGTSMTYGYSGQSVLASQAIDAAGTADDVTLTLARDQALALTGLTISNDNYAWPPPAPGTTPYGANGLNQYTTVNGTGVSYDGNGNLATDGTWTYGYDEVNRLRSASKAGLSATLGWDPLGRLRRQAIAGGATTTFLYDGLDLIATYDGAGVLQGRTVHAPGVDAPLVAYTGAGTADKRWLHADHQGSIMLETNGTGARVAHYAYGPFGEPVTFTGGRFRYTGQAMLAELGLYHYKARMYAPGLGRFLQTDPVGYADDLDLYAYVANDPINASDPLGLARDQQNYQYQYTGDPSDDPSGAVEKVYLFESLAGGFGGAAIVRRALGTAVGQLIPNEVQNATKGGIGPVRIGQIGEGLAGITGPKLRIPSATGTAKFRVPDELTATTVREVKNVQRLQTGGEAGNQLRDLAAEAAQTGRQCVLCVRQGTQISPQSQQLLDELGIIVERTLP